VSETSPTRVALVTGAANGFGWATTQRLAAVGHSVILVDRSPEVVGRAEDLMSRGHTAQAEVLDVSASDGIVQSMRRLLNEHERIDILVNNAGMGLRLDDGGVPEIEDIELADWNRVVAVNLTATFLFSQAVVPAMRSAGWGRIVNISSRAGRTAVPASEVAYSATKAGIIGLTRRLGEQLAAHGVTVNAIAPGRFDTALANASSPEVIAQSVAGIPAGRVGDPAEIAAAIAFLVSPEAGYITGAVLDINGGSFIG
jgi:3-oxoacyl-[acyl-carrier protein] reductase